MAKIKETVSADRLAALEEKYGKNSIVKASSSTIERVKESTSTGSLTLDIATGISGVPKDGKITHILGKESSSKTTLSLHIIKEEQKKGNMCAFLDVEGTLDLNYAENIGVDLTKLYIVNVEMLLKKKKESEIQAISGEEWLEILCDMLDTRSFGIIVLDSIAELCPMSELQAGVRSAGIAGVGRLMSKSLRTINAKLMPTNCGLIFLNQYRVNIGGYGNPYIECAGEAMKYYTALKIEITKSLDKDSDGVYGLDVKAKITKSKVSIPHKEAAYYVEFGKGIQRQNELVELADELKVFQKAGSHYSYGEQKLANGYDAMVQFLKDNEEFSNEIEQKVMALLNPSLVTIEK
jgi:recombination protein RecA